MNTLLQCQWLLGALSKTGSPGQSDIKVIRIFRFIWYSGISSKYKFKMVFSFTLPHCYWYDLRNDQNLCLPNEVVRPNQVPVKQLRGCEFMTNYFFLWNWTNTNFTQFSHQYAGEDDEDNLVNCFSIIVLLATCTVNTESWGKEASISKHLR